MQAPRSCVRWTVPAELQLKAVTANRRMPITECFLVRGDSAPNPQRPAGPRSRAVNRKPAMQGMKPRRGKSTYPPIGGKNRRIRKIAKSPCRRKASARSRQAGTEHENVSPIIRRRYRFEAAIVAEIRDDGVGGSSQEPLEMPSEPAAKNAPPSVPPHAAVSLARKGSDVIEKVGRGERI